MNRPWMIAILLIGTTLLLLLKTHERRTLTPYFKAEKTLKLKHFTEARSRISHEKVYLLELWESMLTGRVAPLDRWVRTEYRGLALAHVFTPSGFHLSAILWPLLFLFRKRRQKLWLLSLLNLAVQLLPGQGALKRMASIKLHQQLFGMKAGFILALILDILSGSLDHSPLGFTYSFLFLGIIYSGARGLTLFIWFFMAQVLIAFIQGSLVSPLLLIASPILNTVLAGILPILFVMSWPLAGWQLTSGLFLLEHTQALVSFFYKLVTKLPMLEANVALVLLFIFISLRNGRLAVVTCIFLCGDLNIGLTRVPLSGTYEWQPQGKTTNVVDLKIYREDGICRRDLVNGVWFETCSPRRRSRKKET